MACRPTHETVINPATVSATPRRTNGPGLSLSTSTARIVENIGVVFMMVDVIALPIVRMPRKLNTRDAPGTNRPTTTKMKLSAMKSRVSDSSKK